MTLGKSVILPRFITLNSGRSVTLPLVQKCDFGRRDITLCRVSIAKILAEKMNNLLQGISRVQRHAAACAPVAAIVVSWYIVFLFLASAFCPLKWTLQKESKGIVCFLDLSTFVDSSFLDSDIFQ